MGNLYKLDMEKQNHYSHISTIMIKSHHLHILEISDLDYLRLNTLSKFWTPHTILSMNIIVALVNLNFSKESNRWEIHLETGNSQKPLRKV